MGKDKIRYYRVKKGFAYWQPNTKMHLLGFRFMSLGRDGPQAQTHARALNQEWDEYRAANRKKPAEKSAKRSRRTASRPELPKRRKEHVGFIYAISEGDQDPMKVGKAKDPERRVADLQSANAKPLKIYARIWCDMRAESLVHKFFGGQRMSGEWFMWSEELQRFLDLATVKSKRRLLSIEDIARLLERRA